MLAGKHCAHLCQQWCRQDSGNTELPQFVLIAGDTLRCKRLFGHCIEFACFESGFAYRLQQYVDADIIGDRCMGFFGGEINVGVDAGQPVECFLNTRGACRTGHAGDGQFKGADVGGIFGRHRVDPMGITQYMRGQA